MNIEKNSVVSLSYKMYDDQNKLLDETVNEPMIYLHGGYDGIFPVVEEALHGKQLGDEIDIHLSVEDAFGEIDSDLIRLEDLDNFPVKPEIGMIFEGEDNHGNIGLFRISEIANGKAVVDGNHPFAGMKIRFVAKIVDIRAATTDELAHGHVHIHGLHNH
ncbi:MAG: peptidylprolyl isomerase [Neisseriaceae bacterium]|nr:peptidylprolyl isomerase [Neisseriaceae bacterium]